MYTTVRDPQAAAADPPAPGRWRRVSRNVLLLGLTSLFTDISSEMLTAVLPLYLVFELKMTPLQFGVIDGLYQGASALVRVASGLVADAGQRYKQVATLGYAMSAASRAGLLAVGSAWAPIAGVLMLDRIGKGIRTAPRDALITLSSDRARLGEAFGAHRAMDTVGAMIGPLVALGILALAPGAYDAVFVVSLAFGLIGVAIIALFVKNLRAVRDTAPMSTRWRLRAPFANRRFRALLVAGAALGLMTATDALIYLMLQRGGAVTPAMFPLLFVGTSVVYLVLALPVGRLADRLGRHRVFVAGHVAVMAIYGLLLAWPRVPLAGVVVCVALLGVYYAATDGVLAALAGGLLAREQVTTGLALVSTAWALSRLGAAALFGALWSGFGEAVAVGVFLSGLTAAAIVAAASLRVTRRWQAAEGTE